MLTSSLSRSAGGVYDAVRWLARSLEAPHHTVEVFGLRDAHTDADQEGWGRLSVHVFQTWGPSAFGYAPDMAQALLNANLDLIHLHGLWMYPSMASGQWAARTRRPVMITPHGMLDPWARRNSYWKKTLAGFLYESRNLRNAACFQAGSLSEYKAIRETGFGNPIAILPNGVHMAELDSARPEPPWAVSLGPEAKVLLYLGRLHPKKGLDLLLDAWKQSMQGRDTDWHVVIAGVAADDYEQVLRARRDELGLSQSVHFIGPQYHDAKLACYRNADAMILPSYSEGVPMVVLDGWAHGLPVLMTPECNLPIGFERDAAIRVETAIDSVRDGLLRLFAMSDDERSSMGQRARQLAQDDFSWDAIASQVGGVYRWLLGGGQRPDCVIVE